MKFAARILSFFFVFLLLFFVFKPSASAQVIPNNTNPDVPNNLHTWTQSLLIEVSSSLTCLIAGVDPINPKGQCLGIDTKTNKIGYVQSGGGTIGIMGGLIAMTYTQPAHTSDFIRYLSRNFGIAKPAYADNGIGFTGLSPLLGIWTAFRNITYLLFVIVFIVIGFAIMLRVHIDPRTVMTIENQIPKIIVALVLVTFSFAIAGFLIDLMYVFIYLAIGIFSTIGGGITPASALNNIQGVTVLDYANNLPVKGLGDATGIFGITTNAAGAVKDVLMSTIFAGDAGKIIAGSIGAAIGFGGANVSLIPGAAGGAAASAIAAATAKAAAGTVIAKTSATAVGSVVGAGLCAGATGGVGILAAGICGTIGAAVTNLIISAATGALFAAASDPILGGISAVIAFLVIGVAMLFALFRLWFTLIKAYVFILIDVVFAPFWIVAGLIPGGGISFTSWLRDIAGNLMAFPATIVMFLLGKVFMEAFSESPTAGQPFIPPLIGNAGNHSIIASLIGLGIILMTPAVVDMMKGWLKAPKLDISAIGKAIGAGSAVPGRTISGVGSMAFGVHYDSEGHISAKGGAVGKFARSFFGVH